KALELDPCYANAWYAKGFSLHSLGRDEEAILCYDKALELDPCNVNAWYNKSVCLAGLGRSEESFLCFKKALELDPSMHLPDSAKR
ncbi:tetratricopeptide repeat protein, partial [Candidatus Cryosericum septentrionale]